MTSTATWGSKLVTDKQERQLVKQRLEKVQAEAASVIKVITAEQALKAQRVVKQAQRKKTGGMK